jgi:phosphoglycerate dehydrogenase-like enzyme
MKIVLTDNIPLADYHLMQISELGDVCIYDDLPTSEEEIIRRVAEAEIATANWISISRKVIESSHNLRYVIAASVGYDSIDTDAAAMRGIKAINCPTHNFIAVSEHTFALILALIRKIVPAGISMQEKSWMPELFTGRELYKKRLGLIGYGKVGKKVEMIAQSFNMNVSYINSHSSQEDIDVLVSESDFVSLHVPFRSETRHLIDARRLSLMKDSAYLINTSRGSVVDQNALMSALRENSIAGAALDVFEGEPKGCEVSEEILEIAKLPNAVVTPHIAYRTEEMLIRLGEELIENIKACINGTPINVVN